MPRFGSFEDMDSLNNVSTDVLVKFMIKRGLCTNRLTICRLYQDSIVRSLVNAGFLSTSTLNRTDDFDIDSSSIIVREAVA